MDAELRSQPKRVAHANPLWLPQTELFVEKPFGILNMYNCGEYFCGGIAVGHWGKLKGGCVVKVPVSNKAKYISQPQSFHILNRGNEKSKINFDLDVGKQS